MNIEDCYIYAKPLIIPRVDVKNAKPHLWWYMDVPPHVWVSSFLHNKGKKYAVKTAITGNPCKGCSFLKADSFERFDARGHCARRLCFQSLRTDRLSVYFEEITAL